jgi:hypothetical protein
MRVGDGSHATEIDAVAEHTQNCLRAPGLPSVENSAIVPPLRIGPRRDRRGRHPVGGHLEHPLDDRRLLGLHDELMAERVGRVPEGNAPGVPDPAAPQ